MIVYELMHYHAEIAVMYGEGNFIGLFTSEEAMESVKAHCRTLPGYRDYPHGFCSIERHISGIPQAYGDTVFAVGLTVWEKSYAYNYESFPELFWCETDAEAWCAQFKQLNQGLMKNAGVDVEIGVGQIKLDSLQHMVCAEGFTVERYPDQPE